MAVFLVVPLHEAMDPFAGRAQTRERLARIGWRVFQRPDLTLRVEIVITDRRPTEVGRNVEPLQGRQHGRTLHRAAIVRMQHESGFTDALGQTGLADQNAGMRGLFVLMHFPADDLAAGDVLDQVQPVEGPTGRCVQILDIKRLNLIGPLGLEALWLRDLSRCLVPSAPVLLAVLAQHAVEGRL